MHCSQLPIVSLTASPFMFRRFSIT